MRAENDGARVALIVTAIPPETEAVTRHLMDLHDEVGKAAFFSAAPLPEKVSAGRSALSMAAKATSPRVPSISFTSKS
jgi:hypothetical protein